MINGKNSQGLAVGFDFPSPREQPFIGTLKFVNGTGGQIQRTGVGIVNLRVEDKKISFALVDNLGTKEYALEIKNLSHFLVIFDHQKFAQRFKIVADKLVPKN